MSLKYKKKNKIHPIKSNKISLDAEFKHNLDIILNKSEVILENLNGFKILRNLKFT